MRLFYKRVSFLFLSLGILSGMGLVHGQAADVVIRDFKSSSLSDGVLYESSDLKVIYTTSGASFGTYSTDLAAAGCYQIQGGYSMLALGSTGSLELIPLNGKVIKQLQPVGLSRESAKISYLYFSLTIDGSTYPEFVLDDVDYIAVNNNIPFSDTPGAICNNYIEIPETAYEMDWDMFEATEVPDFRSKVEKIRLSIPDNASNTVVTDLLAFGIWFEVQEPPVGIDNEQQSSTHIQNLGNGLYELSKESDVRVYTLQGQKVVELSKTRSFSLADYPKGVYLLTLKDETSIKTTKVIR